MPCSRQKLVATSETLLGVGAMKSPRSAPAGLLVAYANCLVMLDGGGSAAPRERIDAWPDGDAHSELERQIRE